MYVFLIYIYNYYIHFYLYKFDKICILILADFRDTF